MQEQKFENVEELIKQAETTFHKGMGTLNEWGEQARVLLENKPAVILAAAGVSGFVTGALVRQAANLKRRGEQHALPVDPMVLLAGGLAVGMLIGPSLIEQAYHALSRAGEHDGRSLGSIEGARSRSAGSMNERPFEKM